jgi:RimK family alpha-L-glutamate ligase
MSTQQDVTTLPQTATTNGDNSKPTEENVTPSNDAVSKDDEAAQQPVQVELALNLDNMTEEEKQKAQKMIEIHVRQSELKYNLKPQVISDSRIIFYNAQDKAYYERQLKNPDLYVWLLVDNAEPNYTAKRIWECAYRQNIQVRIVETTKFDLIVSQEGLHHVLYDGEKVEKLPDAVLPRLGARVTYFSLAVVRQLEKMGVLVLNKNESLEISKDKLYTVQTLGAHNLPIPKTMIAKFPCQIESISREFTYPIILKKSSGSQGKGVMLVQNPDHMNDLVDMIDQSKPLIFQEYISNSAGRDIRVIVVGGKAIGGMMRVAKKGFKSNFHQGGFVKPVKLTPAIEWLAIEAARLIGLDIAGVDILIDKNTYKICEINSTPGFQGFELATGIDVPKAILDFVRFRCGVWKKPSKDQKMSLLTIPVQAEHLVAQAIPQSPRDEPSSPLPKVEQLQL